MIVNQCVTLQSDSSVCVGLSVVLSEAVTAAVIIPDIRSAPVRRTVVPDSTTASAQIPRSRYHVAPTRGGNPVVAHVSGHFHILVVELQFRIAVPRPISRPDPSAALAGAEPASDRVSAGRYSVAVPLQPVVVPESLSADPLPVAGRRRQPAGILRASGCFARSASTVAAAAGFSELPAEQVQSADDFRRWPVKSRHCWCRFGGRQAAATKQSHSEVEQVKAVGHHRNCQQNHSK